MTHPAIAIRPYRAGDAEPCYRAAIESVQSVFPFMPWCRPDLTLTDQRAWVEGKVQTFVERKEFAFAICSSADEYLGCCELNHLDPINLRANLGYWVRSSAQKQGLGTSATRLLRDWAFQNTDLQRLEIVVSTRNSPSLKVAAKAGATREAVLKNRLLLHGEFHDAVLFAFVRG